MARLHQLEHNIQADFFSIIKLVEKKYPDIKWIHAIPNGGQRNILTAIKLKREGVKSGVHDVFVPLPCGEYHGLYIEFKAGKNKMTLEQKEFQKHIEAKNYKFALCYTSLEAINALEEYTKWKIIKKN